MEAMLNAEEVAALLKMSRRSLETMLKAGRGPSYVRLGGLRRWRKQDIEQWLDEEFKRQVSMEVPD